MFGLDESSILDGCTASSELVEVAVGTGVIGSGVVLESVGTAMIKLGSTLFVVRS